MAYVLAKTPTFPVKKIEIYTQENGAWVKETVDAVFMRRTNEELDKLRNEKPADVLRDVLVSVHGLKGDNQVDVVLYRTPGDDFAPEDQPLLEAVLAATPLMAALATAFWKHQVKGPEKN